MDGSRRVIVVVVVSALLLAAGFGFGRISADTTGDGSQDPKPRMQQGDRRSDHERMHGANEDDVMTMSMAEVDSEAAFLAAMIPHHQEAIDSANVLLEGTERPEMRAFARDIIAAQQAEVDDMTAWLERWYPDEPEFDDYEPMMREDLDELTGDELDQAFLEDMLEHHMMAVHMARELLERDLDEHAEVTKLATSIRDAQMREILQMHDWLDEWFDVRAPHGGMMHGMGE